MPVSLAVGDISSFRKYVKYIGRAYQKRSVAMIQLCRLFLEISPGKPDQVDALKSLLETVEDALKAAVDAGKERSDAADTAFATAEEELDWYAGWQHPEQQTVLDDVQNIIEDAAQKDSQIMKIHKRLSTRLGLNKTDSSSLVKVHFQILHAPTDRREAPVVTCELGPDVKISELLWTFSRLPEDQRISLKQNPHFYFSRDLSDQASAYDDQFKLEPLKDLKPEKNSVVMVLLDRAGQIFVDYQKFSKTYGNIWRPHNTIILKDLQGTLEAANRISPSICGEVCIWQRGGGRPGEDLSEWTKVLDNALDLPDVDWLIRSETSPDEAFDIEVTGGWERCSPVTTPGCSDLRVQDHPTPTTPLQEGIHTPLEEVPSPTSESSSIPTVGFSSQESSYPIADVPPSGVTVNIPSEESEYIVEGCPSPDEDKDVLTLKDSSPLESALPQVEVAVHPPVPSSNISHELIPPPPESELAPASAASSPEKIVSMAVAGVSSEYEAIHTQTQHDCFSSKLLTTPIGGTEVPCSSRMLTPLKNTMPNDVHLQTEVDCPHIQPTRVPRKSSVVGGGELAPTSSASTPVNTPGPEHTPPETEVVHAPVDLERPPPKRLTQRMGYDVYPTGIAPTQVGITPSNGAFVQTETAHLSSVPLEQPKPASATPTSNHTPTTSKTESTKRIESVGSLAQFILHPGNKATHAHGATTLSGAALSERAHSRAEVVGRLEIKRPPAPSREPTLPIVKMPEPIGRMPLPYISPTPSEHARPKIGAASTSNQNVCVSPKSRIPSSIPSTATDSVPSFSRVTPSGGRIKVEAPPPPVRPAPVRPDPRTTFVGKQSALLNSMPVSDIELPSRSRIKSHPKKMTTPISQRQSVALSTQINVKLGPTVQPSGPPSALPVVRSAASLVPSHKDVTIFHTSLVEPSNLGMNSDPRGGYQCYARGLVAPPSAQDSIRQSRRSTVVSGQMPPQLTALSSDKYAYAQRPVEKSMPSSARNRSNSASIARQDSTAGTLSHSSQTRSSSLAVIMKGQGAAKSHSIARSATPPRAITTAVKGEKVDATIASTPPNSTHMSSIFNIKPSAMQPRKAIVVPERVTSHPAVRSSTSNQPVIGLQSVPSPAISSRNISYPITMARPDKTAEILSYNSRTDIPGVAAATDTRGDLKGHTTGSRMLSTLPVGGAVTSASSVWNSTTRTPSRIKTKDLISRHKQQSTGDPRPPSIAQSLSKSPTSGLSHSAPLAGKPNNNRIDSGIELWDYDPHGVMHNRRRGQDTSSNGHGSPRDIGPSFPLPTNSSVVSSNVSSKDNTGPLLSTKKSRASILGSPSPIVGRTHSSRSSRRMSTPPPPESVKASLPSVAGSSTSNLSSTPPGRREPFINRKPQPASQSTSQGGAMTQSGFSTPPRSSTPSSMSHSASITTSTHATMFTPATSFTIPSRAPSPAIDVTHKSWFRRIVLDPVKSKLGYGS